MSGDPPGNPSTQIIDPAVFAGILQAITQQNQSSQDQLELLRQQLANQDAARLAAEAQTQRLIADQAQALKDTQAQQAKEFQAIAAALTTTGPNSGLPPEILPPKSYPKIEDFKTERNENTSSRLQFYVFRNALQNRLELHAQFRAACLSREGLQAGAAPATVQA